MVWPHFPAGTWLVRRNPAALVPLYFLSTTSDVLTTTTLRIYQFGHRWGELASFHGPGLVCFPPRGEDIRDEASLGVVRLGGVTTSDWVSASQCQQGIANPLTPDLVASKRPARFHRLGILAAPTPDRQDRDQEIGTTLFDPREKAVVEWSRLWILRLGVKSAENEAAGEILTDRESVAGNRRAMGESG